MPAWRKILCAIDFSPPSRFALLQAAELTGTHGSELVLLHVREIPPVRAQLGLAPSPPGSYEAEAADAWRQLERAGKTAEEIARAHVGVQMVEGSPVDDILRIARESEADLVVLGTHGRTGLRRAMLGSVAESVVRRAPCSVLVVPPEELIAARPA
jgi:nucleotide-binding universal stress UspA family protein